MRLGGRAKSFNKGEPSKALMPGAECFIKQHMHCITEGPGFYRAVPAHWAEDTQSCRDRAGAGMG